MWLAVSLIYSVISLALLMNYLRGPRCIPLTLLCFSIWVRYFLGTQYEYTFDSLVAGLSVNAMYSLLIVALGITLVIPRYLNLRFLFPTYLFVFWIILSGTINHSTIGLFNVLTKWIYFLTTAILLYAAINRVGLERSVKGLLWVMSLPLGLQILSIVFGEVKAGETDGSKSFIGGYGHEAVFSVMILTFFACTSCLRSTRGFGAVGGLAGLIAANYRTSIIASAPLTVYAFGSTFMSKLDPKWRLPGIVTGALICAVLLATLVGESVLERFADISTVVTSWQELTKPFYYYTTDERNIFSARVFLWSQYLTEFFSANLTQQLFGFGPEGWVTNQPKYAHNTFVSMLYEYGFLGFLVFLIFIISNALFALKAGNMSINLLVLHVSFLILNLSTMPLWQIEGLIFYAIINAITWSQYRQSEHVRASPSAY